MRAREELQLVRKEYKFYEAEVNRLQQHMSALIVSHADRFDMLNARAKLSEAKFQLSQSKSKLDEMIIKVQKDNREYNRIQASKKKRERYVRMREEKERLRQDHDKKMQERYNTLKQQYNDNFEKLHYEFMKDEGRNEATIRSLQNIEKSLYKQLCRARESFSYAVLS